MTARLSNPTHGRDPLSIRYDTAVRRVLLAAIRGHQRNPNQPTAARTWIASPGRQFRDLDHGRHTANERAFIRALYYQVQKVPKSFGVDPMWSPDITWTAIENRAGQYGRYARVRLFRYWSGSRHVQRKVARPWIEDTGFGDWRDGSRRSVPGDRIDSNRKQAG